MTIVITGASRGIGAALARQYEDAGEEVIGTARGAGAQAVLDVMEKLGAEDPEFAPAELLRDLAKNGGKFTEIDTGGLKV